MAIESKRVERIVGFFVILLILITTTMVFLLLRQRDWFAKKFEVRAVFEKGTTIAEGTPVLMEGIQVGDVKELRFSMQNQLEAVLSINVRYRRQVRKNSVATVVRSSLFASPQIDISVGSLDQPILIEGDLLPAVTTTEPSIKDFLSLGNNLVALIRDLRDPKGPFQRIMRNMDEISSRIAQGSGSVPDMLRDDGKFYQDSRTLLGDFSGMIKDKDAVPITITLGSQLTLSPQSQLIVNLSEKLDRQTDIFVQVANKFDKIADRLLDKSSMAGAVLADPEFYGEIRQFIQEGRTLLVDLQHLAVDLRSVVPELPGLIEEGRTDLKEMGRVLRGLQRLPFMGVPDEKTPKPETLHVPGRMSILEDRQ